MKVDPFVPQLLVDYDLFTRKHAPYSFGDFMATWYAVEALVEAAEADGEDPFTITTADVARLVAYPPVN